MCPHCYSKATRAVCVRCTREMCEDCISHHPEIGKVCGLCFDEATKEPTESEIRAALDFGKTADQHLRR